MVRLGPADLVTLDSLITAGIVKNRADGLRWALSRIREHPSYAQLYRRPSNSTLLGSGEGGGEPVERDGLAA